MRVGEETGIAGWVGLGNSGGQPLTRVVQLAFFLFREVVTAGKAPYGRARCNCDERTMGDRREVRLMRKTCQFGISSLRRKAEIVDGVGFG